MTNVAKNVRRPPPEPSNRLKVRATAQGIHHGDLHAPLSRTAAGWSSPGGPSRAACDLLLCDCPSGVSLALPGLLCVALRAGRNAGSSRPARAAWRDAAHRARGADFAAGAATRNLMDDAVQPGPGCAPALRPCALLVSAFPISSPCALAAGAPAADRNERAFPGAGHAPLAGTPRVWPALPCVVASIASGSVWTHDSVFALRVQAAATKVPDSQDITRIERIGEQLLSGPCCALLLVLRRRQLRDPK